MSVLYIAIFSLVLVAACVGSWHGALRWHNRPRDANTEDPRDQEIRELTAALNIARKDVDRLKNTRGDQDSQLAELQDSL